MTAIVAEIPLTPADTLVDCSTLAAGRQIVIAGSAVGCRYSIYRSNTNSGAVNKVATLTVDAAGDASVNLPGDASFYYKYTVDAGTPGGTLKVWVQGALFPAT